jgi:eukaryotic-like serine/threonine-protein kinase
VVMYECLTGARPFTGATAGEVFARIRDGKYKPLTKLAPQAPPALEAVIKRCMKVKIDQRFFDAAELRRDLEMLLARQVSISHQALVVAFLRHRNKITETEALARLTSHEMEFVQTFSNLRGRRSRLVWVAAALAAAGGGLYLTQDLWMPWIRQLTHLGGG